MLTRVFSVLYSLTSARRRRRKFALLLLLLIKIERDETKFVHENIKEHGKLFSTASDPVFLFFFFFFFFFFQWKRDAILSYRRVGGSPVASKLPMFANTMIAGGLRLMLPTARVCLIYRGRTLGRAKSSTAPLGSEPTPTCRCNDAP